MTLHEMLVLAYVAVFSVSCAVAAWIWYGPGWALLALPLGVIVAALLPVVFVLLPHMALRKLAALRQKRSAPH